MRVVIDTSIFVADLSLNGTAFRVFSSELERLGLSLHLPEIIVDEVEAKYRQRIAEEARKISNASNEVHRLTGVRLANGPDREALDLAVASAIRRFRDRIAGWGARIWPYPAISHQAMAARSIGDRHPFVGEDRGYRDALIWETVLAMVSESSEPIALVARDRGLEAEKSKEMASLHSDLIDDLKRRCSAPELVELFRDLGTFNKVHVESTLAEMEKTRKQLDTGAHPSIHLHGLVEGLISEYLPVLKGIPIIQELVGVPAGAALVDLYPVASSGYVTDVRRLSSGEWLVRARFVLTSLWETSTSSPVYGHAVALVAARKEVVAQLSLTFDPKNKVVTSRELNVTTPFGLDLVLGQPASPQDADRL